jgi:hypothetical protein
MDVYEHERLSNITLRHKNTLPVNVISLEKVITTDFLFALKLLPYFNLLAPKDFLIIWLIWMYMNMRDYQTLHLDTN